MEAVRTKDSKCYVNGPDNLQGLLVPFQATRSTILPCDLRLAAPGPLGDTP